VAVIAGEVVAGEVDQTVAAVEEVVVAFDQMAATAVEATVVEVAAVEATAGEAIVAEVIAVGAIAVGATAVEAIVEEVVALVVVLDHKQGVTAEEAAAFGQLVIAVAVVLAGQFQMFHLRSVR